MPVVRALLDAPADAGVDPNRAVAPPLGMPANLAPDHFGVPPLVAACTAGHLLVVQAMVRDARTDVNIRDADRMDTPLIAAVRRRHVGVVRFLLGVGADAADAASTGGAAAGAGGGDPGGAAAAAAAAGAHDGDHSSRRRVVDVNGTNRTGETPLLVACNIGAEDVLRLLLADSRVDVRAADKDGANAAWYAARFGHQGAMRMLLDATVQPIASAAGGDSGDVVPAGTPQNRVLDLNRATVSHSLTPFGAACRQGDYETAVLLGDQPSVDVNRATVPTRLPTPREIERGHTRVQMRRATPETPFMTALRYGHEPILRYLVAHPRARISDADRRLLAGRRRLDDPRIGRVTADLVHRDAVAAAEKQRRANRVLFVALALQSAAPRAAGSDSAMAASEAPSPLQVLQALPEALVRETVAFV